MPPNVEQSMYACRFGFNDHLYLTRRQPLLNQDNFSCKSWTIDLFSSIYFLCTYSTAVLR